MSTGIARVLPARWRGPETGTIVMCVVIVALGSYLIYPMIMLLVLSFDTSPEILASPREWGLSNWLEAWDNPLVFESIRNSFLVWFLGAIVSLDSQPGRSVSFSYGDSIRRRCRGRYEARHAPTAYVEGWTVPRGHQQPR